MKVEYIFDYDNGEAEVIFQVDLKVFTKEVAQELLDFFIWDYDIEGDPVDEIISKMSIEALIEGSNNYLNKEGVISKFKNKEGFVKIDGSEGVLLTRFQGYEFDEDLLEVRIENLESK